MPYSISFALLVPRFKLLRLDVFPFILIYGLLGYLLHENYDDESLNLYFRLAIIGAAFIHCTTIDTQHSHTYLGTGPRKRSPLFSTVHYLVKFRQILRTPATFISSNNARDKKQYMVSLTCTSKNLKAGIYCTSSPLSRENSTSITVLKNSLASSLKLKMSQWDA